MMPARAIQGSGALERLALTRGGLQRALRAASQVAPADGATASGRGDDAAAPPPWLDALWSQPTAALVREALRVLWSRHPWREAASAVGTALDAALRPTVQRHPVMLMLGAGLLGALLARLRPWRWIPGPGWPAVLAGLMPQLLATLLQPRQAAAPAASPSAARDQTDSS